MSRQDEKIVFSKMRNFVLVHFYTNFHCSAKTKINFSFVNLMKLQKVSRYFEKKNPVRFYDYFSTTLILT